MAGVKFTRGSAEWNMFCDLWAIAQKYWIPEDTEEYWDGVVRESTEFCAKYADIDCEMASDMMAVLVDVLDQKSRIPKKTLPVKGKGRSI